METSLIKSAGISKPLTTLTIVPVSALEEARRIKETIPNTTIKQIVADALSVGLPAVERHYKELPKISDIKVA